MLAVLEEVTEPDRRADVYVAIDERYVFNADRRIGRPGRCKREPLETSQIQVAVLHRHGLHHAAGRTVRIKQDLSFAVRGGEPKMQVEQDEMPPVGGIEGYG